MGIKLGSCFTPGRLMDVELMSSGIHFDTLLSILVIEISCNPV